MQNINPESWLVCCVNVVNIQLSICNEVNNCVSLTKTHQNI